MVRRVIAVLGLTVALALPLQSAVGAEAQMATDTRTQIVLQWRIDSTTDISEHEVWALEDRLEAEAEGLYDVDSHDFDVGVASVFIYTNDANVAVRRILAIYQSGALRPGMRIGVREYDYAAQSWGYRPVFPRGLHRFELVY